MTGLNSRIVKLWKLEIVGMPESAYEERPIAQLEDYELDEYGIYTDEHEPDATISVEVPGWKPEGWLSDPDKREWWIATHQTEEFFWPKSDKLYSSKRSAQTRAKLIESYGATVNVVESEPIIWLTPERIRANRIEQLQAELAALEGAAL